MGTVKHKLYGTAKIVRREGDRITIKYDQSGKEVELKTPESFMTTPCHFEPDAELRQEVDAAIEAKKEAERVARESREAARAYRALLCQHWSPAPTARGCIAHHTHGGWQSAHRQGAGLHQQYHP